MPFRGIHKTLHKVRNDTLQRKIVLNITKKPFNSRENFAYVDMHE